MSCVPSTVTTSLRSRGDAPVKLIFLNRYFYPDRSATSQMLSDLAFGLGRVGYESVVITSRQHYDDPRAVLPMYETKCGVVIRRIWTTRFGRGWLGGRALDYLSYAMGAAVAIVRIARSGDVVVVNTDPPMLSVVVGPLARLRRALVVNWLQDIFPEVAVALGVRGFGGAFGRFARRLRDDSLQRATMNVAIGDRMAEHLGAMGIFRHRITVIHNWADGEAVTPIDHRLNRLRETWCLGKKFVVGYSGNFGRAHEFVTLLDAAERLQSDPDLVFLFVGGGHQRDAMRTAIASRRLQHRFMFQPYQPRESLRESLGVPDVHWLSLRPELEGLIVPSKFYGILAAGRPVFVVGDLDGEIGRLVRGADCGLVFDVGNGARLAEAIGALRGDPGRCAAMGARGRALFDARYTRRQAIRAWKVSLERLTESGAAGHLHEK